MAEFLSAGVYIEEVPSSTQVIQSVSTSNMGIVGFSPRGPTDKATLITSFDQYARVFGGLSSNSRMGHTVAAFYANGGRRCFVVRVVPSDAVSAAAYVQSRVTRQQIGTGDSGGTTTFQATANTSALLDNTGASPLVPTTVELRWRGSGSVTTAEKARNRANSADLATSSATHQYEGRVKGGVSGLLAFSHKLFAIVPGSATVHWKTGGVTKNIAVPAPTSGSISTVTGSMGEVLTFDHATGILSLDTKANAPDADFITVDYTPTTAPAGASYYSATDDGSGNLTGNVSAGTITYANGAYNFTVSTAPHNNGPVLASYTIQAWHVSPASKGVWGNDLRIDIRGSANYFLATTGQYQRFDVLISLLNQDTGNYEVQETYEELVFDDATSSVFFPDVLNELSDLVTVAEPGGNLPPNALNGVEVGSSWSPPASTTAMPTDGEVIAGGDSSLGTRVITATLKFPLAKRSLFIYYLSSGVRKQIQDDGKGNLTGDIDTTQTNTIDYSLGTLNVALKTAADGGSLVVATYSYAATEAADASLFTGGTDGTFGGSSYSRSQFTDPTLQTNFKGLYALSKIDEIMQVVVPDFAGDTTVSGDLLDYADSRAGQPAGGDRFVILATPKGLSAQDAVDWFRYSLGRFSKYAALYWPWVKVADPLSNGRNLVLPPLGHVAGVYARTDTTRNVGKAPGGVTDGALRFLTGLEYAPTQGDRDYVYPNKINPLISSPQTGLAVWGVRTIAIETEWRYINARRLFMFLEKSVFNATHWVVFENNGPALWARIKTQLSGWLTSLFNESYFAGTSPKDAFFVIVDQSNNPPNVIDQGQIIVDVGAAPNKPAEFCRFRFQQKTLGA